MCFRNIALSLFYNVYRNWETCDTIKLWSIPFSTGKSVQLSDNSIRWTINLTIRPRQQTKVKSYLQVLLYVIDI